MGWRRAASTGCPGGVHLDVELSLTSTDHIARRLEILFARGDLTVSDIILVVSVGYPRSGNRMNLIQTHRVRDPNRSSGSCRSPRPDDARRSPGPGRCTLL
jgi:hypothetical protein